MYCTKLFASWRPQWITRHAGHTEYFYCPGTRPSYRKAHPISGHSSVAPKTGFAVLQYHARGSIRRNSFLRAANPAAPLYATTLRTTFGRKETRIPAFLSIRRRLWFAGLLSSEVGSSAFISYWRQIRARQATKKGMGRAAITPC